MIKRSDSYQNALFGLIFALAVLYFATPHFLAAYAALDGVSVAGRLAAGGETSDDDLRKLAISQDNALKWRAAPEYARQLAVAYSELTERVSPENQNSLTQAALDATVRELRARPLNGMAWWRLGKFEYNLAGGPTSRSAAFHWRSVQVAPHMMNMMPVRLNSIILNWFRFEPAARPDLLKQFGAAWRRNRPSILKIAETPDHRSIIRGAMASDPALLGEFEARLAKEKARAKR